MCIKDIAAQSNVKNGGGDMKNLLCFEVTKSPQNLDKATISYNFFQFVAISRSPFYINQSSNMIYCHTDTKLNVISLILT